MKHLLVSVVLLSIFSLSAHASSPKAICQEKIEKSILAKINKTKGFNGDSKDTRSICGIKPLLIGAFAETYAVCASDEVEPSEWVVTVGTKKCNIQSLNLINDGSISSLWD
ncbi:MAG: hypothetical protein ACOYL6_16235 [Bacteriovoracaceae bacterium]